MSEVMTTFRNVNVSSPTYSTNDVISPDSLTDISMEWRSKAGCVMVNSSAFQLHDESEDVVSSTSTNIINNVNHGILMPFFFFIGFPNNIINLTVFFKHGLKQRINLCLFCLSLMDLLLLTLVFLLYAEKIDVKDITSSYRHTGHLMRFIVNNHLLGCYGFGWASQFVSAVISGERCICVVWPLRAATMLKTKTVGIVLLVGILLIVAGRFVVAEKYLVVCVTDVVTGITSHQMTGSEFHRNHKKLVDVLDGVVYGLVLPFTMCGIVVIATSITAVKLGKSVEFRRQSTSSSGYLSAREIAVTRMLIYLSIQFIILQTPNTLMRVSLLFLPELNTSGNWANLYFFMAAIVELCATLNSSLNFVVYYFFGSKYRETLHEMLGIDVKDRSKKESQSNEAN